MGSPGQPAPGQLRIRAGTDARTGLMLLLVALVLRVAYAWIAGGPHATPYSDPAEYDAVAWNLARGMGFSLSSPSGVPFATAVSPPLMPWIEGLLYAIVGHHYFAAVMLQCVVGALAPPLLAALGRALFDRRVGVLAGWICAVNPLLVFFCGYLLTETWLITATLLALWASVKWVGAPRPARALGAGLGWGLASLARPTVLLFPFVVLAWAWLQLGAALPARQRAWQAGLLLLGLVLALAPWTARNALVFGGFVPVATRGGGALYVGNNAQVWNDPVRRGGGADLSFYHEVEKEFRGLSEIRRDALFRQRAVAFLRAHVAEWPAMAFAKLKRFWRFSVEGGGTGTWQGPGSPLGAVLRWIDPLQVWSLISIPLALWGTLVMLAGPRRWFQALVLWMILYVNLLAVVFWGSLRMRATIEPMVVLLGAVALADIAGRLWSRRTGAGVPGTAPEAGAGAGRSPT